MAFSAHGLKPELKQILIDVEIYGDFVRFRETLKGFGLSPMEANRRTTDAYFEHNPRVKNPKSKKAMRLRSSTSRDMQIRSQLAFQSDRISAEESILGNKKDTPFSPSLCTAESPLPSHSGPVVPPRGEGGEDSMPNPLTEPLCAIDSSELAHRHASEVETIRWVARNMNVGSPDIEDCPDPTAWALLSHCRSSLVAAAEFWKMTFPKLLPSRAQMEALNNQGRDTTGDKAVQVIDDLLRFREGQDWEG